MTEGPTVDTPEALPPPPQPLDVPDQAFSWAPLVTVLVGVGVAGLLVITSLMHAPQGCYPEPLDLAAGSIAVAVGCIASAFAFSLARRWHNPIHYITAAGSALFVVALVGQRASADSQSEAMHTGCPVDAHAGLTAWADTIYIGILKVWISPIAIAGLLIVIVGICAALLFERVGAGVSAESVPLGRLADDDTV